MPGMAPAKVQHWARRLSRSQGKEYTPVWSEEDQHWTISVVEKSECDEFLHMLMHEETGENYDECTDGHTITVVLRFRRSGWRQGLRPWRLHARVDADNGLVNVAINPSDIMALLAKPTNPQGEGKAHAESSGNNKQQMQVKRTTVIRV